MESEDPARLADQFEGQADEMERRTGDLQDDVQSTREDWRHKRADPNVPGAVPENGEEGEGEASQAEGSSETGRSEESGSSGSDDDGKPESETAPDAGDS